MNIVDALAFVEAVHSTSLSHEFDCVCRVCRAAGGDAEAMEELVAAYVYERSREN